MVKCIICLFLEGTEPLDMEAFLTNPNGETEPVEIMDLADSMYDIKFVPNDIGVHTVSLKYKGLHISGQYQLKTSGIQRVCCGFHFIKLVVIYF